MRAYGRRQERKSPIIITPAILNNDKNATRAMKKLILALVALLPFSLGYGADRIVIGNVSRTVEQLPNYAATDKGFFAQEGIQGDVVLIGSTDTLIQALIAGHVQVAIVDPSAAINAVERGAALKIIGGTVPIAAYTLVGCPKYKAIKDLRGTTIGVVSLVSGSTIFLREMLKAEGLELNRDYAIIQNGPTTQRLASLKACNTSATMILGGDLPRSRELGFPEIARLHDYIPNLQFHSLIVDGHWAETYPQLVVRYLKAMVRAMQWAHVSRVQRAQDAAHRAFVSRSAGSSRRALQSLCRSGSLLRCDSVSCRRYQNVWANGRKHRRRIRGHGRSPRAYVVPDLQHPAERDCDAKHQCCIQPRTCGHVHRRSH